MATVTELVAALEAFDRVQSSSILKHEEKRLVQRQLLAALPPEHLCPSCTAARAAIANAMERVVSAGVAPAPKEPDVQPREPERAPKARKAKAASA